MQGDAQAVHTPEMFTVPDEQEVTQELPESKYPVTHAVQVLVVVVQVLQGDTQAVQVVEVTI